MASSARGLGVGLRGVFTGRSSVRGPVVATPASPADWPTVVGDRPGSSFEPGDGILRVGERDVAGMGPHAFYTTWFIEAGDRDTLNVVRERGGEREEIEVGLDQQLPGWLFVLLGFSFGVPRIAVFLRVPPTTQTRLLLAACTVFSNFFMLLPTPTGAGWFPVWMPITLLIGYTSTPLVVNAAQAIPAEAAPRNARGWAWPWLLWPGFFVAMLSYWFGVPLAPAAGLRLYNAVGAVFSGAILVVLTLNYVRSGAIGRRQLRWLLWGFYVGLTPMLAVDALSTFKPELNALQGPSGLSQILIPISVAIAVVRHNLYDVDRLISATASYSVLTLLFVSSAFAIARGLHRR